MQYRTITHLSEAFDLRTKTVRKRVAGMRNEISSGRYPPEAIIDTGKTIVDEDAFKDFLKYGSALSGKNTRDLVPKYGG